LAAARPPPRGEGADFPVLHPPRVGQSPGGSLARPSRPHLRPGPGEPVRWARPPCGGAPPLGPFRHRLHRPRWGVSLRFTRQAWPQLLGWPKSRPAGTTTPSHRHLPARPTGTASPPGPGRPWLWRFGGHLPSLEAGSGRLGLRDPGGESPPPWILLALALASGLHAPQIPILPFRGGLLPVGESPRPRPSP